MARTVAVLMVLADAFDIITRPCAVLQSGQRDSNPRHSAWEAKSFSRFHREIQWFSKHVQQEGQQVFKKWLGIFAHWYLCLEQLVHDLNEPHLWSRQSANQRCFHRRICFQKYGLDGVEGGHLCVFDEMSNDLFGHVGDERIRDKYFSSLIGTPCQRFSKNSVVKM